MGILAGSVRDVFQQLIEISVGRMGHVDSEIYLGKARLFAAASAITGKISQPSELWFYGI